MIRETDLTVRLRWAYTCTFSFVFSSNRIYYISFNEEITLLEGIIMKLDLVKTVKELVDYSGRVHRTETVFGMFGIHTDPATVIKDVITIVASNVKE